MHVYRPVVPLILIAPDLIHQLLPAEDPAGVAHKQLQEFKLLGGQLRRQSLPLCVPGHPVQHDMADGDGLLRVTVAPVAALSRRTPQKSLNAGFQLQYIEWLGNIIIRSALKPHDFIHILTFCS